MEETISIKRENVLTAYEHASEEQKTLLESMFGEKIFQPKNIMERVKTFEDACEVLGEDHQYVKAYREWMRIYYAECKDITAYLKLRIICESLNECWKPKFDGEEYLYYYPWFWIYTKKEYDELDEDEKKECRVVGRSHDNAYAVTGVQASLSGAFCFSRLVFKTRELAEYCEKQFIDIWADYLFA